MKIKEFKEFSKFRIDQKKTQEELKEFAKNMLCFLNENNLED